MGNKLKSAWTRDRVETRLIAAFRAMPHCPVYREGRAIRTPAETRNPLTDVLEWSELLHNDPDGCRYLWTWARCRAANEPFSEQINARGWRRSTAEDGRRRAADTIAVALNQRVVDALSGEAVLCRF